MKHNNQINRNKWFYTTEMLTDIAIIVVSYYFGFRLQRPELFTQTLPTDVAFALLYIILVSITLFTLFKTHRCGERPYSTTILYIILSLPLIALSSIFIDYIFKGIGIWRRTLFYAVCIQFPLIAVVKFIFLKVHKKIIKLKPSLIVGNTEEEGMMFALKIIEDRNQLYKVKYIVNENSERLYDCINKTAQIFLCPQCSEEKKAEIIEYCVLHNIDCAVAPNTIELVINSGKLYNTSDVLFLNMDIRMDIEARIIKRTMDIVISAIALIILLPIILIVSLLIKLQDGGKAIYSQIRATRGNKEFNIYKFRTMIEDAEQKTGVILAKENDERVTKLGRILRKYRLDEIPQLWNVLMGDMTLVGPRPERPELIEKTVKEIPEYQYRTLVKAGLTGLAQTMAKYNTEFKDKLLFDLYYVNNHSLLLDLKILFYTIHVLTMPSVTSGMSHKKFNIKEALKKTGNEIIHKEGYIKIKDI